MPSTEKRRSGDYNGKTKSKFRFATYSGNVYGVYDTFYMGGGVEKQPAGWNWIICYFLFSVSIVGVDVFVILSGFFSCQKNEWKWKKPIRWLMELEIIRVFCYIFKVVISIESISLRGIVKTLLPSNYFCILFCALYCLQPLLNTFIRVCEEKSLLHYTLLLFLIFAVYPTGVDAVGWLTIRGTLGELSTIGRYGSGWGYTITNFSLLYLIGACLRAETIKAYIEKWSVMLRCVLGVNTVFLMIWAYLNIKTGQSVIESAYEYCNPLIIVNAVIWFVLFAGRKIKDSHWITRVAKITFTMFLVHPYLLECLDLERIINSNLFVLVSCYILTGVFCCAISYIVHYGCIDKIFKKVKF